MGFKEQTQNPALHFILMGFFIIVNGNPILPVGWTPNLGVIVDFPLSVTYTPKSSSKPISNASKIHRNSVISFLLLGLLSSLLVVACASILY